MSKPKKNFRIQILEFVNTNDKSKVYNNFQELLKEGGVTQYCFKYIIANDKEKRVRTSQRITKLDLYRKEAYTTNDNIKYIILNEI